MPDLSFHVESAAPQLHAASPLLAFKLMVANADPTESVHTVVLRCQIQIEATNRRYNVEEQKRLLDLFGEPERWGQTLRTTLWTHTNVIVPPFNGRTEVDLSVPCSFDFNIAATKYFAGLEEEEIPLCLQFSGTVFYAAENGALQVSQIAWDKEAKYRLPVKTWQKMMEAYYPNSVWLSLRRDVFDRLNSYKMQRGFPTWERTLESILPPEKE